jgi:deoxyguanosine kinase
MNNYNFIAIEGTIGAGKTSLASMIAEDYNAKLILEGYADNPFFRNFIRNQKNMPFRWNYLFLPSAINN